MKILQIPSGREVEAGGLFYSTASDSNGNIVAKIRVPSDYEPLKNSNDDLTVPFVNSFNNSYYFEVDSANEKIKSVNSDIYSKDGTELVSVATNRSTLVIEDGTTKIDDLVAPGITDIYIPSSYTDWNYYEDSNDSLMHGFANPLQWGFDVENVYVDEANSALSSENGVLFNKDQTELLWLPFGRDDNYTIPDTVTTIGDHAISCLGLDEDDETFTVTIPASVTSFTNSVSDSTADDQVASAKEKKEDSYAMYYHRIGGNQIARIRCYKDSYAETYAKRNGLPYVLIDDSADSSATESTSQSVTTTSESTVSNAESSDGGDADLAGSSFKYAKIEDYYLGHEHSPLKISAAVYDVKYRPTLIINESEDRAIDTYLQNSALIPDQNNYDIVDLDMELIDMLGDPETDFSACTITYPLQWNWEETGGTISVASMKDGEIEGLPAEIITVDGVECIRFTTTHFSEYAIIRGALTGAVTTVADGDVLVSTTEEQEEDTNRDSGERDVSVNEETESQMQSAETNESTSETPSYMPSTGVNDLLFIWKALVYLLFGLGLLIFLLSFIIFL